MGVEDECLVAESDGEWITITYEDGTHLRYRDGGACLLHLAYTGALDAMIEGPVAGLPHDA